MYKCPRCGESDFLILNYPAVEKAIRGRDRKYKGDYVYLNELGEVELLKYILRTGDINLTRGSGIGPAIYCISKNFWEGCGGGFQFKDIINEKE